MILWLFIFTFIHLNWWNYRNPPKRLSEYSLVLFCPVRQKAWMCIFVVVTVQNRNTNREAVVNNTVDNTNSRLKELARIQKFLFGHPIHGEGKKKKKKAVGFSRHWRWLHAFLYDQNSRVVIPSCDSAPSILEKILKRNNKKATWQCCGFTLPFS